MVLDEIELSEDLSLTALTSLNDPFFFYTTFSEQSCSFYLNIAIPGDVQLIWNLSNF